MPQALTTERVRNIFYGGAVFSCFLLLALTFETMLNLSQSARLHNGMNAATVLAVALGKSVWENYDCAGCHALFGEGAYFAPELSDVYQHYQGNYEVIKKLVSNPDVVPGHRIMPQYNLSKQELQALVEFLKYNSTINTAYWPSPQ